MIDPYSGYGLQKQSIEAMQHQCAQCQADKHGGENVEDGFAGHGIESLLLRVVDVMKYNPLGDLVNPLGELFTRC